MASKRHQRRKACTGKVRYSTASAANAAAYSRRLKTSQLILGYSCQFCGGFHIGHLPKRMRQTVREGVAG